MLLLLCQGNDLYKEMIESGVIKTGDKASESKCTLVYGQMNEPPGARARVALTGVHAAQDEHGRALVCYVYAHMLSHHAVTMQCNFYNVPILCAGLTVAEYFRDQEGQDVLLFIDNIFRFTQANSEVLYTSSHYGCLFVLLWSAYRRRV